MAPRATVKWNEKSQRWMAWVRFPDGTRRKVERVDRSDAEALLNELLALRATGSEPTPRRQRLPTFGEVIDEWLKAGCPSSAGGTGVRHAKQKSPNTIANAECLLATHVRPHIGALWVDRTRTKRVEDVFARMAKAGYATSTIDRTWGYLNQSCQHGQRERRITTNPVADVLLPEIHAPKQRKSLTIDQVSQIIFTALPHDPRPAMWLTGLMCGLRPGELAGLRWRYVDIDSNQPSLEVAERVNEVGHRYVGQTRPKTQRSRRRIGLHPLLVAALTTHREEMKLLGLYHVEAFVFCTSNGTPYLLTNLRRYFRQLCERAELGSDWTTYELRHSFVSLVADQLDDLVKVADLAGHVDTKTTQGYRHPVRPSLPHAIEAWNTLLGREMIGFPALPAAGSQTEPTSAV
jgi:integrase